MQEGIRCGLQQRQFICIRVPHSNQFQVYAAPKAPARPIASSRAHNVQQALIAVYIMVHHISALHWLSPLILVCNSRNTVIDLSQALTKNSFACVGSTSLHFYNPPFCERHRRGYETRALSLVKIVCYTVYGSVRYTTQAVEESGRVV